MWSIDFDDLDAYPDSYLNMFFGENETVTNQFFTIMDLQEELSTAEENKSIIFEELIAEIEIFFDLDDIQAALLVTFTKILAAWEAM